MRPSEHPQMQDGQVPEAYPGAGLAGTVAILAQGTHRGDALCAALFFDLFFPGEACFLRV